MTDNRRFAGLLIYAWGIAAIIAHLTNDEFSWMTLVFSSVLTSVGAMLLSPPKRSEGSS